MSPLDPCLIFCVNPIKSNDVFGSVSTYSDVEDSVKTKNHNYDNLTFSVKRNDNKI